MWLTNVHPVTLKDHLIDFSFCCHLWEDHSFNRCWFVFYSVNHTCIKKIKPCINLIRNELLWLLNKSLNLVILISNNNTVFSWVFNLSNHNCTFFSVTLMVLNHITKREFADHIRVKNKQKIISIVFHNNVFS